MRCSSVTKNMVWSSWKSAEVCPNRQSCGNRPRGRVCRWYAGGL